MLVEAVFAGKIDIAILADPVAVRVLGVLFVCSVMREPPFAAIAVGHRVSVFLWQGMRGLLVVGNGNPELPLEPI
jgi:hypothetical protein